uniref:AAA domain-containing protein n=1 Tax=Caenorhabditis tropicalis TaxID=1561998 RepID=A0A1I7SZ90_9PELO
MSGWTDLPKNAKQKVIEKLDFMSRMENTYLKREGYFAAGQNIPPYAWSYKIIADLFVRDSVTLGAFEIEIGDERPHIQQLETAMMMRSFKSKKIRTKKLVTNWFFNPPNVMMIQKNLCDEKVLETIEVNGLRPGSMLKPYQLIDRTVFPDPEPPGNKRFTDFPVEHMSKALFQNSEICMEDDDSPSFSSSILQSVMNHGFISFRFADKSGNNGFDEMPVIEEKLNDEVRMKRMIVENRGVAIRWMKSKCGMWSHMVDLNTEHKFSDFFKNEKCGLRWLCKDCTDPFDFWYYHNIPRRALVEPEWLASFIVTIQDSPNSPTPETILIQEMHQKYKEEEEKTKKTATSDEKKSWGFKKWVDEATVILIYLFFQEGDLILNVYPPILKHPIDFEDRGILEASGKRFSVEHGYLMEFIKSGWFNEKEMQEAMDERRKQLKGKKIRTHVQVGNLEFQADNVSAGAVMNFDVTRTYMSSDVEEISTSSRDSSDSEDSDDTDSEDHGEVYEKAPDVLEKVNESLNKLMSLGHE